MPFGSFFLLNLCKRKDYLIDANLFYCYFRKYKLPMSCIIPFPKRNDSSGVPEFPPGRNVLAVYPGTTALYKASVVSTPRKVKFFKSFTFTNFGSLSWSWLLLYFAFYGCFQHSCICSERQMSKCYPPCALSLTLQILKWNQLNSFHCVILNR